MSINIQSGNGQRMSHIGREDLLPFLAPDENSFRRLSVNSAWTSRPYDGLHDVTRILFDELIRNIRSRQSADGIDIDTIQAQRLNQIVEQRLQGIPEIAELETADLSIRLQVLRDFHSRRATRLVRIAQQVVSDCITEAANALRTHLQEQFQRAPLSCEAKFDAIAISLKDHSSPTPDSGPWKRFQAAYARWR
jgi:hypothetical protein